MKKLVAFFTLASLILVSCGETKKEEVKKEVESPAKEAVESPKETAPADADLVALGEKLFTDKTCVSCHQLDAKIVGPSVKDIVKVYEEQNGDLVQFLKGEAGAIVDTDPGQVAIMKANLDGFVKDLGDDELKALEAYMLSVK